MARRQAAYRHPDTITDEALAWYMRLQDGPLDVAAREEFEQWRASDSRCEETFARLERMHDLPSLRRAAEHDARASRDARGAMAGVPPIGVSQAGAGMLARMRTGLAAAVALVVLAAGILQGPELWLRWQADHITAVGERQSVRLPDGSAMTLNTASAVALDFEDGNRRVRLLRGEAYFDVHHDDAHPFVVTAGFSETRNLGTAFVVRRGAAEDAVVLEEGAVSVGRRAGGGDRAMLDPGQMVVARDGALLPVEEADLGRALAWLDGRVVFRDQSFEAALAALRRYYGGRVIVMDGRLRHISVSGNYHVDEPEAAIRTLAEAVGVSVIRLPAGVLILR